MLETDILSSTYSDFLVPTQAKRWLCYQRKTFSVLYNYRHTWIHKYSLFILHRFSGTWIHKYTLCSINIYQKGLIWHFIQWHLQGTIQWIVQLNIYWLIRKIFVLLGCILVLVTSSATYLFIEACYAHPRGPRRCPRRGNASGGALVFM